MVRAAVGLGSNLGDRARHLAAATAALAEVGSLVRVSSLYETAPIGGPEQGAYINSVVVLETELSARGLLESCRQIEREHGRERRERWGPRTLDLDLLLYGQDTVADDDLTVPHPRMTERRFVIEPLLEAWPDAVFPDGRRVDELVAAVADQEVRRIEPSVPSRMASLALFTLVACGALAIWWLGDWLF